MRVLNLHILTEKKFLLALATETDAAAKSARKIENERCAGVLDQLREQLKGKNKPVVEKTLESSAALIRKSLNG